jgi:hypothetical protein
VTSPDVSAPLSTWTPVPGSTNSALADGTWQFIMPNNASPQFFRGAASWPYSP